MKITKNKDKRIFKNIAIAFAIILVASGIYFASAYAYNLWPFMKQSQSAPINATDLNPPTNDQKENGNAIKDAAIEQENKPTPTGTVDITITSANQNDGILQVRTLIQATTNTGECTLTLTKASSTVTKKAGLQALPSASTCEGFDVPISELSTGIWLLSVSFENDTIKGTSSRDVEIK